MWFRRQRIAKKKARDPRRRILLWATLISLFVGAVEFGEPLDDVLRSLRNDVRRYPASGQIVVVGIDDKTLRKLGRWPWPRTEIAAVIDKLNEHGARRIYYDFNLGDPTNPVDDRALEEALERSPQPVIVATRFEVDPVTKRRINARVLPNVESRTELATINWKLNYAGEVWRLPFGLTIDGVSNPSMSARMAGVQGASETWYRIDHAIDVRSVPTISAVDVLRDPAAGKLLAGKDVIFGPTADQLNDKFKAPGQGFVPGALGHVLGAETLRQGIPYQLSWLLPFALALLVSVTVLFTKRRVVSWAAWLGAGAGLAAGPIASESNLIFVDIAAAVVLLAIVGGGQFWIRVRQKASATNAISGLPNLTALRQADVPGESALVIGRVLNFAEITSSLPLELERAFVEQIVNRFALGIGGSKLYQGEEGIFAWIASQHAGLRLSDQIEGLHALLTSPVIMGERHIDLSISFGVENGSDRSLTNRIGSALVAADEATAQGVKWKGFDPASLKDAEWKLSLLGRLETAIESGEVWVAYQPKLDIATNQIIGAEALVRWSHPEKGDINPEQFVLVAEQHGRIERLTLHVLERAIEAATAINGRGVPFSVAVNLSARLLDSPYLAHTIATMLRDHNLPARCLTLEVTESAAMSGSTGSMALLHELRRAGIGVSIDDYGTGFSTLEYLRTIPATEIKIDKSFVSMIERSNSDRLLVNSTIQLAHELGRKVVAEGVETPETLQRLRSMGCDIAQGYLIGRPLKFAALSKLVLGHRSDMAA